MRLEGKGATMPNIGNREVRRNAAALRQVLSIARQLELTQVELARVLGIARSTLTRWSRITQHEEGLRCPWVAVERMGHLLGIWRGLVTLFPTPAHRIHWIRHANSGEVFRGLAPIVMLCRADRLGLVAVRVYLQGAMS